jgi:hypothetical protein
MLMCSAHWRMVPSELQREVYRTVKLRGRAIDETWAPWWRAAHRAIAHVAFLEGKFDAQQEATYIAREDAVAKEMED